MLNARNIPRACQSCRLQLLSLFEHGFTTPSISNASRTRPSTRLQPRPFQPRNSALRTFSTSANQKDETPRKPTTPEVEEIESIVRRARRTFGQTLPKDYLSTEEYILYERLYGPPLRETQPDDLELHDLVWEDGGAEKEEPRNVLLRENEDGEFEEVDFDPEFNLKVFNEMGEDITSTTEVDQYLGVEGSEGGEEVLNEVTREDEAQPIQFTSTDQREYDAIQKLRQDLETSMAQPVEVEEELEEEYEEDEEEPEEDLFEEDEEENLEPYISSDTLRTHPHTIAGRFGTNPSTIYLPKEKFVVPFTELLERTNLKHVADAAEKAFGGKGLPNSTATRSPKNNLPQKHIGLDASQHRMTEIEADAYISSVMPGMYATVAGTLAEVRKRLGPEWIRNLLFREGGEGPRVLDAGAGGAGLMAWRDVLQTEWDILKDDGIVHGKDAPSRKTTVLTGSDALRHRMSTMLDNTTFLPRLPDYVHASNSEAHLDGAPAQGRKSYDVIIAPHTLFPLKEEFRRKHMIQNLWSLLDPNGGVLILIEKGVPRGFEAIAGARSLLLDKHISSPESEFIASETQGSVEEISTPKETGMIVAPCTNHLKCPMYPVPGLTPARKDFCHFEQRYIRPAYLQKILGATSRNYEDLKYSYLVVRRGVDERKAAQPLVQGDVASEQSFAGYEYQDLPEGSEEWASAEASAKDSAGLKFNPLALPRVLLPALKRRGHVTFDLCTPSGKLERWTVPKSFSKQAYRDARKINWGDLWALGAKTRVVREPRLGKGLKVGNTGLKGIRDGKMGKGGKKAKKNMFEIQMGNEGMVGLKEVRPKHLKGKPEKRTKGGRYPKAPKPITEDDL